MPKALRAPDNRPRLLSPTTTPKLAERVLATSEAFASVNPLLNEAPPREMLLALLVAEESARYVSTQMLASTTRISERIATRWMVLLTRQGLVEQKAELVALTDQGYALATEALEAIYAAQRKLD